MGEFLGNDEAEGEAPSAAAETGSAAASIALDRLRRKKRGGADEAEQRFLAEQSGLIADQREHLREQLKQMRLKHFGERLKVTIQMMTIALGAVIVASVGWMAVEAARAEGVVIKAFTVAPDLARRGVTGEVVASQLLDKLTGISDSAQSGAEAGKFGAGWGQTISLQIPETGVNLGEVDRWLREKLGHEQTLAGEAVTNPDGTVTLSVRLDGHPLPAQTGAAADLPLLLQRSAETIYRRESPITYTNYLFHFGRFDEGGQVDQEMTDSHDPLVRAYGYGGLGIVAETHGRPVDAVADFELAEAQHAGLSWPAGDLGGLLQTFLGYPEAALRAYRRSLALAPTSPDAIPEARREMTLRQANTVAFLLGDHATALAKEIEYARGDNLGSAGSRASLQLAVAGYRTWTHDGRRAEADAQAFTPRMPADAAIKQSTLMYIAFGRKDWAAFLARIEAMGAAAPGQVDGSVFATYRARALLGLGRLAEAQTIVAATPLACQPCVIDRGHLAEAQGRRAEADHWFAEASRMAPSIPDGPVEWGQALLARGDAARAAVQFHEALRRSPRAEEALEGLGEALAAQGDAAGAVKQYAAANALTPKWGRLHLRWGEALAKLGKADEARAQFRTAAGLDLSADEKAELAKVRT